MTSRLSSVQIQSYQSDEFLIVEELLSAKELYEWRLAVDAAVTQRLKSTRLQGAHNLNLWKTNELLPLLYSRTSR